MTERNDGLNNPLSRNSGLGCSKRDVKRLCDRSAIVESYDDAANGGITIEWTFGGSDTFTDMQAAIIAIVANDV